MTKPLGEPVECPKCGFEFHIPKRQSQFHPVWPMLLNFWADEICHLLEVELHPRSVCPNHKRTWWLRSRGMKTEVIYV